MFQIILEQKTQGRQNCPLENTVDAHHQHAP